MAVMFSAQKHSMKSFLRLAKRFSVMCFAVIGSSPIGFSQLTSAIPLPTVEHSGKTGGEILWDQFGIPHIYGPDLFTVVRGYGYAQMENHAELILQKNLPIRLIQDCVKSCRSCTSICLRSSSTPLIS